MKNGLTISIIILIIQMGWTNAKARDPEPVKISMQKRIASELDNGAHIIVNEIEFWQPERTAIIVCDMWDMHWCRGATERVNELAPAINEVLKTAREKGVFVVHSPSDVMDYYKNAPQRKLGKKYPDKRFGDLISPGKLDSEAHAIWPIDQGDGGCDCKTKCRQDKPWTRQHESIEIMNGDAISDSGSEIAGLFQKKGIRNVILVGVHANMCIVNRSFGLRSMTRLGLNTVLMRDLTDGMYNHEMSPNVSHFTGNNLIVEYIETYICPTIVSGDFTGEKQFRFENDERPMVAFITAESEYRANQRLPEFAGELLLKADVNCEFALGKPVMKGEGRHNIENLQILSDADLAVFFIRRRALEPEQMDLIRDYVSSGKPVLGIRTASHAFDARKNVPREGGGIVLADGSISDMLAQWPEFDKDVLGGNYQGHFGHLKEGTKVSIVPGMEGHPLLIGFPLEGYISPNWLYRNRPLRGENIQVLLTGTIPGELPEPVLWINRSESNLVIYTSLGHWDDWEEEGFRNMMHNSVNYLLGKKIIKNVNHEKTDFYK